MVLFSPPFREISTFTRPGARWNEDAVGGGGSFLYVLDGATSLDAAPVMDPVSDAAWLVRETARWLDRHLPEASRPLEDILAQLKRDGYDGIYTIEHYGANHALEYLKDSVAWVQARLG